MSDRKRIDIDAEFSKIRDIYAADSEQKAFNALIYGDFGTGKTWSLRTCPKPVLIHSFDPGGARGLQDMARTGEVLIDARFEQESSKKPTAYGMWEKEFDRLRTTDFFEGIGTYVIDSVTTWGDALMNEILRKANRAGTVPQIQDYLIQMLTIRDVIHVCTGLPCNFIALGHITIDKDETTGKIESGPLLTGKLSQKLPLLFDEVYVSTAKSKPSGVEYKFITQSNGYYKARSRLSGAGKLEMYEDQDIKGILKKTGYPHEDKPLRKPT